MDRDLRGPERRWRADPGDLGTTTAYDRACQRSGMVSDWRKTAVWAMMVGVLVHRLSRDYRLRRWDVGKETPEEKLVRMEVLAEHILDGKITLHAARTAATAARDMARMTVHSLDLPLTTGMFAAGAIERDMKLIARSIGLPRHLVRPSLEISYRVTFR